MNGDLVFISGTSNHDLHEAVLRILSRHFQRELRFTQFFCDKYPDGEDDYRILDDMRGKRVIVFQSMTSRYVKDQLLTLAFGAKELGAKEVIAVVPFLWARRQDNPRDGEINGNKLIIQLLKASGVDRIILCDIHSEETMVYANEAGLVADNIDLATAFVEELTYVVSDVGRDNFVVYGPDAGSLERCITLAGHLNVSVGISLKSRDRRGDTSRIGNPDWDELKNSFPNTVFLKDEELKGKTVCIREDEVSSGGTAVKVGRYLKERCGVERLIICAAHPVLVPGWRRRFIEGTPFDGIMLGNTIHRGYAKRTGGVITEVDVSRAIGLQLTKILKDT